MGVFSEGLHAEDKKKERIKSEFESKSYFRHWFANGYFSVPRQRVKEEATELMVPVCSLSHSLNRSIKRGFEGNEVDFRKPSSAATLLCGRVMKKGMKRSSGTSSGIM